MHDIILFYDNVVAVNHHLRKVNAKKCSFKDQMKDATAMLQKVRLEYEASHHSEVKARSIADLALQNEEKARAELSAT